MRLNILIGGAAGQGINKVSEIVSNVLASYGYFTFNYRDYQSLIRGGHNFNTLCISDSPIESHDAKIDILVALDERTIKTHKAALKKAAVLKNLDFAKFQKKLFSFLHNRGFGYQVIRPTIDKVWAELGQEKPQSDNC